MPDLIGHRSSGSDPADIVGMHRSSASERRAVSPPAFRMIWYRCCRAYGRAVRNDAAGAYLGRCPGCGGRVRLRIGSGGLRNRMFEAW